MASTAPTLRQSSPWKRLLRQSRRPKTCTRCLSTALATTPSQPPPPPLPRLRSPYRILNDTTHTSPKKIKTYPPPPSHRAKHPFAVADWQAQHLRELDPTGSRTRLFDRDNPDVPCVGDILLVTFKTGDPFAGVCLVIKRRGVDTGILLRNKLLMVGVEMWVKVYSPNVKAVEVVKRAEKRARRGKLYYMRYVCTCFLRGGFSRLLFVGMPWWGFELMSWGFVGNRNTIRVVWRRRLRSI